MAYLRLNMKSYEVEVLLINFLRDKHNLPLVLAISREQFIIVFHKNVSPSGIVITEENVFAFLSRENIFASKFMNQVKPFQSKKEYYQLKSGFVREHPFGN